MAVTGLSASQMPFVTLMSRELLHHDDHLTISFNVCFYLSHTLTVDAVMVTNYVNYFPPQTMASYHAHHE